MKNLIKKSMLMAILMMALVSNASEKSLNLKIISHESKVVQLILNNHGSSEVFIKDIKGFQLYKALIKDKEFLKKFDLSGLPDGEYYFEINSQTKIVTKPFSVASNILEFNKETIVFKPIVRFKNDVIYLSRFTLNNETLDVFLYDDNQHLLYSEKLFGQNNLNRKLNLSNLDSGSYSLVLKSEGKLYNEVFKKVNLKK
jgi:hypothetical protein